jgi:hypothetical protein
MVGQRLARRSTPLEPEPEHQVLLAEEISSMTPLNRIAPLFAAATKL